MNKREIKFRLRINNKIVGYEKWYPGKERTEEDPTSAEPHWLYSKDGKYWNPNSIYCNQKDQYVGLKDKNGKECFEGDIVRILYTDWASKSNNDQRTLEQYLIDIASIGKIEYIAPRFEINFGKSEYGDDEYGGIRPGQHGYIQVIGNVYENPELLEAQKNN